MKKIFRRATTLALSQTARNTYALFAGNTTDAFFAFLFTVLVFRSLEVSQFGTFSAINNFIIIIFSILDMGIGSGVIKFVSYHTSRNETEIANAYLKSGYLIRLTTSGILAMLISFASAPLAQKLFLTMDNFSLIIAATAIVFLSLIDISTFALQARQKFTLSALTYSSYSLSRVCLLLVLVSFGKTITLQSVLLITTVASFTSATIGFFSLRTRFIYSQTSREVFKQIIGFSGWIGLSRLATVIGGRIDTQLVLLLMGAHSAGIYSVSARVASFYPVIVTSFSSVLAPRLSGQTNPKSNQTYLKKAQLAIILLILAMLFGVIIAKPFLLLLFGPKAIDSIVPFQALTIAAIPFVAASLPISIIIYSLKKTYIIAFLSILQFVVTISLQFLFIPRIGTLAPALAMGISNLVTWIIAYSVVAKHNAYAQ